MFKYKPHKIEKGYVARKFGIFGSTYLCLSSFYELEHSYIQFSRCVGSLKEVELAIKKFYGDEPPTVFQRLIEELFPTQHYAYT
jgi:hypothetical protein